MKRGKLNEAFLAVDAVFDLTVTQFTQARQVTRTRQAPSAAGPDVRRRYGPR